MSLENSILTALHDGDVFTRNTGADVNTERLQKFTEAVGGRVALFLGSAISTFKPSGLPMWAKFVETMCKRLFYRSTTETDADALWTNFLQSLENPSVPNYMITETVARRLGKTYLKLLKAFECPESGGYNHIHKWAVKMLVEGRCAAIATTNFDDCLEVAMSKEHSEQVSIHQLTGEFATDGEDIRSLQTKSPGKKVILIVNGAAAFGFVRCLLSQLGSDKFGFIFKFHGSCYEPETCIDTRLQRAQGLPSYLTGVLDILLQTSVWFVAGFSGGDMNDNVDYFRMVHNKGNARIVWLEYSAIGREPGLDTLLDELETGAEDRKGVLIVKGGFFGDRSAADEFSKNFHQSVQAWVEGLDPSWSKLVILDLNALFVRRIKASENQPHPVLPASHWNKVLEALADARTLSPDQNVQAEVARICHDVRRRMLQAFADVAADDLAVSPADVENQLKRAVELLHEQPSQKLHPHAQTWVVSALCGLFLLSRNQSSQAEQALDRAANEAWLVGDFTAYQLLSDQKKALLDIEPTARALQTSPNEVSDLGPAVDAPAIDAPAVESGLQGQQPADKLIAFLPGLDNVSAKTNDFGIPPVYYLRAQLNRARLFADTLAVMPNVFTNSSVFVNEIVFQGKDSLDIELLSRIRPVMASSHKQKNNIFESQWDKINKTTERYATEPTMPAHMMQLDQHFFGDNSNTPEVEGCIWYDSKAIGTTYPKYIRKALDQYAETTFQHLFKHYKSLISGQDGATAVIEKIPIKICTLLATLSLFAKNLDPEKSDSFRSVFYTFCNLDVHLADDGKALGPLFEGTAEDTMVSLRRGRACIVDEPWTYGPLCHELLDPLYRTNIPVAAALEVGRASFFVERDEEASLRFLEKLRDDDRFTVNMMHIQRNSEPCSALLLSQAPHDLIEKTYQDLRSIRQKFISDEDFDEEDEKLIRDALSNIDKTSVSMLYTSTSTLTPAQLSKNQRTAARSVLDLCHFLVREGEALDRMYQEADLTMPGLAQIHRI